MPVITSRHLRRAKRKRKHRLKRNLQFLAGAAAIFVVVGLWYFSPAEKTPDLHKNMRCISYMADKDDVEQCIKWERQKTSRSKVVDKQKLP